MDTKLVSLDASANVSLEVPSSISQWVVKNTIIPVVVPLVNAAIATGAEIVKVAAYHRTKTELQLEAYDRYGRELRDVTLPIICLTKAVQDGLDFLNNGDDWDEEVHDWAEQALRRVAKRRFDKFG